MRTCSGLSLKNDEEDGIIFDSIGSLGTKIFKIKANELMP